MEAKLRTYDPFRGLVFGAWGEASPDVELLLSLAASTGAQRHWRSMGSSDEGTAKGILAWMLRRRWGLTALRENARLKLERLEYVGRGAHAAAERRGMASAASAARSRAAAAFAVSHGLRARRGFAWP